MKTQVINNEGKVVREIELPSYFNLPYREDIINKTYEVLKLNAKFDYTNYPLAGKNRSASGKVRHVRRRYRTAYGRGISRVPRKILLRRKPQGFYWQGAFAPSTRGGFRAHPPKIKRERKINKKEKFLAFLYALAAIANKSIVLNRYEKLKDKDLKLELPLVLDINLKEINKAKQLKEILEKLLSSTPLIEIAFKRKTIRAGKGKMRGRRYKKSAGMLFVVSSDEYKSFTTLGVEIVKARQLSLKDLAAGNMPGRLTAFTLAGLNELDARIKEQAKKLNMLGIVK
ncbi:MAG: 50S ribosomal protein L4 [Candidatus Pacearchaeota archaeon]